jgi:hypothetical protein
MKLYFYGLTGKDAIEKARNDQIVAYKNSTILDFALSFTIDIIRTGTAALEGTTESNYKDKFTTFYWYILTVLECYQELSTFLNNLYIHYPQIKDKEHALRHLNEIADIDPETIKDFQRLISKPGYSRWQEFNVDNYDTIQQYIFIVSIIKADLTAIKNDFIEKPFKHRSTLDIGNKITITQKSLVDAYVLAMLRCVKKVRQFRWLSWFENFMYHIIDDSIDSSIVRNNRAILLLPEFFFVDIYDSQDPLKKRPEGYVKPFYEDVARYFAGFDIDAKNEAFLSKSLRHKRITELTAEYPKLIIFAGTMVWKTKDEHTIYTDGEKVKSTLFANSTAVFTDTFYNTAIIFADGRRAYLWDKQFISRVDGTGGTKVIHKHEEPKEPDEPDEIIMNYIKSSLSEKMNAGPPVLHWSGTEGLLYVFLSICKDTYANMYDVSLLQPDIQVVIAAGVGLRAEYIKSKYYLLLCDGAGEIMSSCYDVKAHKDLPMFAPMRHHFRCFEMDLPDDSHNAFLIPKQSKTARGDFYREVLSKGYTCSDFTESAALPSSAEDEFAYIKNKVNTEILPTGKDTQTNAESAKAELVITNGAECWKYPLCMSPFEDPDTNDDAVKLILSPESNITFTLDDVLLFAGNMAESFLRSIDLSLGKPDICEFVFYKGGRRSYNIEFQCQRDIEVITDLVVLEQPRLRIMRSNDVYRYTLSAIINIAKCPIEFGVQSGSFGLVEVYMKSAAKSGALPSFMEFAAWVLGGNVDGFKKLQDFKLLDLALISIKAYLNIEAHISFKELVVTSRLSLFSLSFTIEVCIFGKKIHGILDNTGENTSVGKLLRSIAPSAIDVPAALSSLCISHAEISADIENNAYEVDFAIRGAWNEANISLNNLEFYYKSEKAEKTIILYAEICLLKDVTILVKVNIQKGDWTLSGGIHIAEKSLTCKDIADALGIQTDNLPSFITDFTVIQLDVAYNIAKKHFKINIVTSLGAISAEISSGTPSSWSISYKVPPSSSVDMLTMPLIGEMLKKIPLGTQDFSVKNFELSASSANGAVFTCVVFGKDCVLEIYKAEKPKQIDFIANNNAASPNLMKWFELNKTFAIVSIHKIGIGLDGSKAIILLDASLNVSPLSFNVIDAGLGVNISKPSDIAFYLSGFGVTFDNGVLAIGGSFSRIKRDGKDVYTGSLLIKFKTISAAAIGEYSSGSLMAYVAISASIGGPPAFFITGIAFGFGFNKKLILPKVEDVPNFPLITAAVKGFNDQTLDNFCKNIKDEDKQNFLAAGVKFTSFKLVNGFLLLSVSFGNQFEIGALGVADISMPPNVTTNPIAKAQLALLAVFNPDEGLFRVEARLTSESYILSKDCKLTGGFASYFWFGSNEHSGDFVITLGGYHPVFSKPAHYPVVPRVGFNWNVNSNLNISGELYFALTPSTLMAGGRLSAVYTQGNLKAWFIAYADFLITWKPFTYDIRIGVSIGASYRIDWWFIHKTFSIELGADLHIWGPEVQGTARISWFIISFTISFSTGTDHSKDSLDWNGFKDSFLLDKAANNNASSDILALSIEGSIGKAPDGTDILDSNAAIFSLISKIPKSGNVRPVHNASLQAPLEIIISKDKKVLKNDTFIQNDVRQNVPAAMWKSAPSSSSEKLKEERIVKNAVCGISFTTKKTEPELFPKTRYISLDELYRNNTLELKNCFHFIPETRLHLSDTDSISTFSKTAGSKETLTRRKNFLHDHGINEEVSISNLCEEAENWFSEYILINN